MQTQYGHASPWRAVSCSQHCIGLARLLHCIAHIMSLLLELRRTSDGGGQQPSEPPLAAPPDLCLREQDDGVVMGRGLHSLPNSMELHRKHVRIEWESGTPRIRRIGQKQVAVLRGGRQMLVAGPGGNVWNELQHGDILFFLQWSSHFRFAVSIVTQGESRASSCQPRQQQQQQQQRRMAATDCSSSEIRGGSGSAGSSLLAKRPREDTQCGVMGRQAAAGQRAGDDQWLSGWAHRLSAAAEASTSGISSGTLRSRVAEIWRNMGPSRDAMNVFVFAWMMRAPPRPPKLETEKLHREFQGMARGDGALPREMDAFLTACIERRGEQTIGGTAAATTGGAGAAATAGCSGLPAASTECAATSWSVEAAASASAPMTKRSRREPDAVDSLRAAAPTGSTNNEAAEKCTAVRGTDIERGGWPGRYASLPLPTRLPRAIVTPGRHAALVDSGAPPLSNAPGDGHAQTHMLLRNWSLAVAEVQPVAEVKLPTLGFGCHMLTKREALVAMPEALRVGYRLIDTAPGYGNLGAGRRGCKKTMPHRGDGEELLGAALADSGVRRDQLFITTKVHNKDQGFSSTKAAVHESLERLGISYVDLLLVHSPCPHHRGLPYGSRPDGKEAEIRSETWRACEDLLDSGLVRCIGVSNFAAHHIEALLPPKGAARYTPAVNQIEVSPFCQRRRLVHWCHAHGIAVQAWGSLTHGQILRPPKSAPWPTHFGAEKNRGPEDGPSAGGVVETIAAECGLSPAQVLLRWGLQKGLGVLPRSRHPPHIAQNWRARGLDRASAAGAGPLLIADGQPTHTGQPTELLLTKAHMARLDMLDEGRVTCWNPAGSAA
eukprot:SAG25_NODE_767_length_5466_cov_4.881871_2_plen_832_part_00